MEGSSKLSKRKFLLPTYLHAMYKRHGSHAYLLFCSENVSKRDKHAIRFDIQIAVLFFKKFL